MSVPFMSLLRKQIEIGRAQRQKEYYVRIGPLPKTAAVYVQAIFNDPDTPVEARLIDVTD